MNHTSKRSRRSLRRVLVTTLVTVLLVLSMSSSAFAWGEILVRGSEYGGVSVYSNFPRPNPWYSRGDSGWGTRYQCVELAQRMYNQMGWLPVRSWGVSYAHQMYAAAPRLGLDVVRNGGGTPAWGDVIVWDSGSAGSGGAGHVAIVTSVSSTRVNFVEENGSKTGRRSLPFSRGRIGDSHVIGWVKKPVVGSSAGAFDVIGSGDVDGDGKGDTTVLYDYGNGSSGLWVFESSGSSFTPRLYWRSVAGGFHWSRAKVTMGDVDADGRDDVIALYDYGNATSGMWVFDSDGSSFKARSAWRSGAGEFRWANAKLSAGDVSGDGKDDAVVLYDYGARTTGLLSFVSNGSTFAPRTAWRSALGTFSAARSKVAVGDVTGDGRDDATVLYDYGSGTSGLWTFVSNGTAFTAKSWWRSGAGDFRWAASKLSVGDVTGNGREDAVVLYDYGSRTSGLWSFVSSGTGFTPKRWWRSDAGGFNAAGTRLGVTDATGDGKAEAIALYNYGGSTSGLWSFVSSGTGFTAKPWWRSAGYYATRMR